MPSRQSTDEGSETTSTDSRLQALEKVDVELLSEHFNRVRTSKKRRGELKHPRYTVIVREDEGKPYISTVSQHQDGSFRPEGDNVVLKFCIRGSPLLSASKYSARLSDKISRRERKLKGRLSNSR